MIHSPNKLEIIISAIVILFSVFSTMITMKIIDVTGISIGLDFVVFLAFTVFFIIGYQAIVNIFYIRWQGKHEL